MKYKILSVLPFLLFWIGCDFKFETNKTINIPYTPQLVANGLFTPDSLWAVHVSKTIPAVGNSNDFDLQFIDNATVSIYEGTKLVETLKHVDSGIYVSFTNSPQAGKTFTLKVNAPSFAPIEATSSVPAALNILKAEQKVESISTAPDYYPLKNISFNLVMKDDAQTKDYYTFIIQSREDINYSNSNNNRNYTIGIWAEADNLVVQDGSTDPFNGSKKVECSYMCPFQDLLMSGKTETFNLTFRHNIGRWQSDKKSDGTPIYSSSTPSVTFMQLSEDLYRHLKTRSNSYEDGSNFFIEPSNTHGNIKGGLGLFAGYISKKWNIH